MGKRFRIYKIIRKSNKLIRLLQFTLLKDKRKTGNESMYSYQVSALDNYRKVLQLAHEELIKALK